MLENKQSLYQSINQSVYFVLGGNWDIRDKKFSFVNTYSQKMCVMHWVCADGIEEQGSSIMYKANVRNILTEGDGDKLKAVGVQLADGSIFHGPQCPIALLA